MPGPPPKPAGEVRRRNAPAANTVRLPAEGRFGAAPTWPLSGGSPDVWDELWATPQAVAWERLGWTRVVARYVKVLGYCEDPESLSVGLLGEARQLEDRLGLTPMSMLRLRWEIVADEISEKRDTKSAAAKSPRKRLKVVASDGVASS
jgi:hypothetical protein